MYSKHVLLASSTMGSGAVVVTQQRGNSRPLLSGTELVLSLSTEPDNSPSLIRLQRFCHTKLRTYETKELIP